MTDEPVSVLDLADQIGKRKQTIFKVLSRLNIQTTKQRSAGTVLVSAAQAARDRAGSLTRSDSPEIGSGCAASGRPEPVAGGLEAHSLPVFSAEPRSFVFS